MKRLLILVFVVNIPVGAINWGGPTIQQRKQLSIQHKINYLYEKYPPEETDWLYDIQREADKGLHND